MSNHANETSAATCIFRLYVAGEAPNSMLALRNLKAICRDCYGEDYRIDVVDVLLSPDRAWKEGVIVTPMVVRVSPLPELQIIGNLSDTKLMLEIFGFSSNDHD
jgi:circadian clock protein KaiB